MKISKIKAREVLDSRGNPTVEVEVKVENHLGRFIVPSGASTGTLEAVELRDNDNRFHGKGVLKAVKNVNEIIAPKLIDHDPYEQQEIDKLMIDLDGTENKSNLGANAILGVSIANLKAAAYSKSMEIYEYIGDHSRLPGPMFNIINGGKHAGGNLKVQEFMIMPTGFESFHEALRASSEVYHSLKSYLKKTYGPTAINVGDEGGFAPPIDKASEAIDSITHAIRDAGYKPIDHFNLGIDSAASEFYENGKYSIDGLSLTADELLDYYDTLLSDNPILVSVEDPFDENDFVSFGKMVNKHGNKIAIVADDITVTNVKRIKKAIEMNSMNYLLLKVNQIGTFTEAKEAFDLTKSKNWGVVISHRSGETEDSFIADLAVGLSAERIKTGATARSERIAKYNQLLRIEEKLGDKATFYNKKWKD